MNGQKLLNNTLKINAGFSFLSGLDFILFDKPISGFIYARDPESLAPMGAMLIGFAVFVFIVSTLSKVNKYLVGAIIAMDALWVVGSVALIAFGFSIFTTLGLFLIALVAAIIGVFAFLQTKGLRLHQRAVRS